MRTTRISEAAFQSDLDLIYATIFDSTKWADVIQRIESRFSFKSGVIFFGDFREDKLKIADYHNFEEAEIKTYNDYYVYKDPFQEYFINHFIKGPANEFVITADINGVREANKQAEAYNEWYCATDSADTVVLPLFMGISQSLSLSFQSSFSNGTVSRHLKRLLDFYAHHLKRAAAMSIGSDLKLNPYEDSRAILVVSDQGKIVDINDSAKKLLTNNQSLLSTSSTINFPHHPFVTKKILTMLANLSKPWEDKGPAELVCRLGTQRWRLNFSTTHHINKPALLISISKDREDSFPATHGLTRIEGAITEMLVDGMDINKISEYMKTGRETTRTHVKHIYAKTSCNTQVELMRKISQWHKGSRIQKPYS